MNLKTALKNYDILDEHYDSEKYLRELCFAKCNCGYILPEPNWVHPPTCAFQRAYEELIK